jgi:hypothetical protein
MKIKGLSLSNNSTMGPSRFDSALWVISPTGSWRLNSTNAPSSSFYLQVEPVPPNPADYNIGI